MAAIRKTRNAYRNLLESVRLNDREGDGYIILKWISEEWNMRMEIGQTISEWCPLLGFGIGSVTN
jgi:hypothetical protein